MTENKLVNLEYIHVKTHVSLFMAVAERCNKCTENSAKYFAIKNYCGSKRIAKKLQFTYTSVFMLRFLFGFGSKPLGSVS
jgi:hypothetical protein